MSNDTIAQRRSRAFEHLAGERDAAIKRAEAAEARAAAKTELIDDILATWEPMTERLLQAKDERDEARRQLEQAQAQIKELSEQLAEIALKYPNLIKITLFESTSPVDWREEAR